MMCRPLANVQERLVSDTLQKRLHGVTEPTLLRKENRKKLFSSSNPASYYFNTNNYNLQQAFGKFDEIILTSR